MHFEFIFDHIWVWMSMYNWLDQTWYLPWMLQNAKWSNMCVLLNPQFEGFCTTRPVACYDVYKFSNDRYTVKWLYSSTHDLLNNCWNLFGQSLIVCLRLGSYNQDNIMFSHSLFNLCESLKSCPHDYMPSDVNMM